MIYILMYGGDGWEEKREIRVPQMHNAVMLKRKSTFENAEYKAFSLNRQPQSWHNMNIVH